MQHDRQPDPARLPKPEARILQGAVGHAKLGYDFSPNSYSYGALSACLAAEQTLDVLREALESELGEGTGT
jgi:hypothetical protein